MLSLIVPVRDWPSERIEACIDSFIELGSKLLSEIVVVDFGSTKKVKLAKRKSIVPKMVRVEAKEWSLAEAINVGVISSSGSVIAKIDADTLISPDSKGELDHAVERVARGEFGLIVSQYIDFDSSVSLASAVECVQKSGNAPSKFRPKWGQGALSIFAKAAWEHIGGFEFSIHWLGE